MVQCTVKCVIDMNPFCLNNNNFWIVSTTVQLKNPAFSVVKKCMLIRNFYSKIQIAFFLFWEKLSSFKS